MTMTFCQRLIESSEKNADKVAMRVVGDDSEIYTYGEMLSRIRSVAYRLEQENVEFGDRIALIGENHPSWAISYLAALYRGAVCVPMDPHGEIETLTNFLENSEAKIAFLSPDMTGKFRQIEEKLGKHIPAVVWKMSEPPASAGGLSSNDSDAKVKPFATANGSDNYNGFQKFEDWAETEFPERFAAAEPPAKLEDTALLMYTSGTTGTPKGVPLTHGNIVAELDGVKDVLKFTGEEKILSLLPLFHAYLQIVNLWVATTYGCEAGYLKELTPAELSSSMKIFKPTMLTTVPRLWYLFHKKIFDAVEAKPKAVQMLFRTMLSTNGFLRDTFNVNLGKKFFGAVHESFGGRLEIAISAGSRFDEEVAIDFYKLGFTIIQGYGLTETSGAATATFADDNRVGSVGKPMGDTEVKIASPDKDGVGEVLIRGGVVFKGYYKNEEATKETFTEDGWFRTGDLGKFDKDGHLFIVGRGKDVIVLPSGKNVHPEDLEVHYLKTPLVEEMAILGITDDSGEKRAGAEKLVAIVVPDFEYAKQNHIANSKEAIRYALDNLGRELPEYQRVRDYLIRVKPLPRTATRKIKRFELKKDIEANGFVQKEVRETKTWTLSGEEKAQMETQAGRALASAVKQNKSDVETVHPQMNLEIDLGLDSLSRAEIFAALEQAFGIEFEAEEAAQALTVEDAINLVQKHAGKTDSAAEISTELNWSKIVKETDEIIPEVEPILHERPIFIGFAFIVYRIFNFFCRIFLQLEVKDVENLKKLKRPFLICPNHQSFLDPFIITSNYPFAYFRQIFHVGASQFFQSGFMQFVARMLQVVPIDPDTQLMKAMKAGAIGLKHGKILNIYPEGERAFDGDLHEFKKGAAILATELDLPILPVALDGVYKVWARRSWRIRFSKVKVRFGEPFYPKDVIDSASDNEAKYEAVTKHLKSEIEKMIEEMRK
jgi:long-chain acyl-CoA synthetase